MAGQFRNRGIDRCPVLIILTVIEGVVSFGMPFGTCPIRTDTISYGVRGKKCTKPAATDAKTAKSWTDAFRTTVK